MNESASPDLTTEQALQLKRAAGRLHDEFKGVFGAETIARFVDESLASMSRASITSYVPLFTERFARERLRALAKIEGKVVVEKPAVLFLCVHNAGRSQMAAGWLRFLAGDGVDVYSGGSEPASETNAAAVQAMAEIGIDIATEFPKPWTDEIVRAADVVVTMGCGDACPLFPGKRYEDWEIADPAGCEIAEVRPIRDDIERRVRALIASLDLEPVA